MIWPLRAHLPGRDKDHSSLCNVKARRWVGKKLVKTEVRVVDLLTFKGLKLGEQCGRCFLVLSYQEGLHVVRQR